MNSTKALRFLMLFAFALFLISILFLILGPTGIFDSIVFYQIRLPRLFCGIAVGGGLAVSGLLIQSTLGNPLADSFSTGVAPAAALGAILGGMLSRSDTTLGLLLGPVAGGFTFAFFGIFTLCVLLRKWFHDSVRLLLSGLILGFTCGSAATLILYLSDPSIWQSSLSWMLGSLRVLAPTEAAILSALVLFLTLITWFHSKPLDLMRIDSTAAQAVGVDVVRFRRRFFVLASAITAICTCMGGIVAFVGLLVPHSLHLLGVTRHREKIPMAFLFGASVYLMADVLGRSLSATMEVPSGIVLSLIGAPCFLYLMIRGKNGF